jgi:hypothetical protein
MWIFIVFCFLDNTERKFQRAIELHKQVNDENDKNVIKIIDELATFYTKVDKFQVCLEEISFCLNSLWSYSFRKN